MRAVPCVAVAFVSGVWVLLQAWASGQGVSPFARGPLPTPMAWEVTFAGTSQGFEALHACALTPTASGLRIACQGDDPYLQSPPIENLPEGPLELVLDLEISGDGQVFWATAEEPDYQEDRSAHFRCDHDGRRRTVRVPLPIRGRATRVRLDPGDSRGEAVLHGVSLRRLVLHPIEIVALRVRGIEARVEVKNHGPKPREVSLAAEVKTLPADGSATFVVGSNDPPSLFEDTLVESAGLPSLPLRIARIPATAPSGPSLTAGKLQITVEEGGSRAVLSREGRPVADLIPLLPSKDDPIRVTREDHRLTLERDEARLSFSLDRTGLTWEARGGKGMVIIVRSVPRGGLFPGIEWLGPGEASSSDLDVLTSERWRWRPDPLQVTFPFMGLELEDFTLSLTWSGADSRPVFALPDFIGGLSEARLAVEGGDLSGHLRLEKGSVTTALWSAIQRAGLPPLPPRRRSDEEQRRLSLAALEGPLLGPTGFGHCVEPEWGRLPYADLVTARFRLGGELSEWPSLAFGGSHIEEPSAWFLTGRAQEWLDHEKALAKDLVSSQRPDGTWKYDGPLRDRHFEDTSVGFCAERAYRLLRFAELTGYVPAFESGMKALKAIDSRPVPRGAQTWEIFLHTPDILASAYALKASLAAFRLGGSGAVRAERWALSGLPFVYLRNDPSVQAYETIAVFGATRGRAPNWMGRPVPWCGLVYADALFDFAQLFRDERLEQVARGILRAAEAHQVADGPNLGCLPDSIRLPSGRPAGPHINPSALSYLRDKVEGRPLGLQVFRWSYPGVTPGTRRHHRLCSPFPLAPGLPPKVLGKPGVRYQLLVDGERVITIDSRGEDPVDLK